MLPLIATIGGFIPGLFGKKLSFKAAKVAGFVTLAVLLVAILSIGKCSYDRSVIAKHDAEIEAKASKAREKAADQRAQDTIINNESEKELNHVIDNAPKGGDLSPASRALACERLRRVGRIPPACRDQGDH